MKSRQGSSVIVLSAVILGSTSTAFALNYKPGEVIVKFKDQPSVTAQSVKNLYNTTGTEKVHFYSKNMGRLQHLKLREGASVEAAVAELSKNADVEFAQPNYILSAPEMTDSFIDKVEEMAKRDPSFEGFRDSLITFKKVPSRSKRISDVVSKPPVQEPTAVEHQGGHDPAINELWGLKAIEAADAWKKASGNRILVADIDTGIDYNHEDIGGNLWHGNPSGRQQGRRAQNVDYAVGYDFVHNDNLPYDDQGHGTHTAGTIGAVGNNDRGVIGVSPHATIMALKFISSEGGGTTSDAIRAIDYAVAHGAKILSNSWGGSADQENQALHEAILRAEKQNVLFVVAAGNESLDNDTSPDRSYPASFDAPNIISVAATDSQDKLAFFSNYGVKTTHLAAPGKDILSTFPGNNYKKASGTSMACPHVAGAAAMVWGMNPSWSYRQVKTALLKTVDPLASLNGKVMSGGRLNVFNAVKAAYTHLKKVQSRRGRG